MLLTPVFRPGEFHGLYSPWGSKELDMTERLSLVLYSGFPGGSVVKNPPTNTGDTRDVGSIPESGRSSSLPSITERLSKDMNSGHLM